ncbi:MAG: DUF1934 domain-containing protein [Anaerovoracaceae bacterium]|nr:DUF1934 domain-containing protein [Anaerovoracaceae bacterium]SFE30146.1 Uncharacterized beta-barrel protein YwiB, DUF1934 family [Peptostreptococcaceae bacterium pGA-8]
MKDVTLKITGGDFNEATGGESVEMITEGKLYRIDNAVYLKYDETELSGMEGSSTTLILEDGKVSMKRVGELSNLDEIIFEKGKRFTGKYETPFGMFDMEVLTNNVKQDLDIDGYGDIEIDYHISLDGLVDGRNKLKITVSQ